MFMCDLHKTRSSMRLCGIFTNHTDLRRAIYDLYKDNRIGSEDDDLAEIKSMTILDLMNNIDYLYIERFDKTEFNILF